MIIFTVFLQKLEPSCAVGAFSAGFFRKALYGKWPSLVLF